MAELRDYLTKPKRIEFRCTVVGSNYATIRVLRGGRISLTVLMQGVVGLKREVSLG